MSRHAPLQALLLQVRDPDDPMGPHEVEAFRSTLAPRPVRVRVFDLLGRPLGEHDLEGVDFVLMGGSGRYSAALGGPWLNTALASLRLVHALCVPAFASCWGFQAMAAAMGGTVVQDRARAEVGTHRVRLTPAGLADPLFGPLGSSFYAHMGHEDLVEVLPPGATPLASSETVPNQAYRFEDAPIYCTQFHPELDARGLFARLSAYPRYVEEVAGVTLDHLVATSRETAEANKLLGRFVDRFAARPGARDQRDQL